MHNILRSVFELREARISQHRGLAGCRRLRQLAFIQVPQDLLLQFLVEQPGIPFPTRFWALQSQSLGVGLLVYRLLTFVIFPRFLASRSILYATLAGAGLRGRDEGQLLLFPWYLRWNALKIHIYTHERNAPVDSQLANARQFPTL